MPHVSLVAHALPPSLGVPSELAESARVKVSERYTVRAATPPTAPAPAPSVVKLIAPPSREGVAGHHLARGGGGHVIVGQAGRHPHADAGGERDAVGRHRQGDPGPGG